MDRNDILALDAEGLQRAIATVKGIEFRISTGVMDFVCGNRLHRDYAMEGEAIGKFTFTYDGKSSIYEDTLPNWATDIAAAWELVEEMFSAGWNFYLESEHNQKSNYWVMFHMDGSDGTRISDSDGEAPTAPLAIARAWLLARQG